SICESAARTSRSVNATESVGEIAAKIRQTLDGMCVNTMVLTSPIRPDNQAATGNEKAESTPDQKKNRLADESENSNRSNSQSASSDCTTKPPAKASRLNKAASL